MKSSICSAVHFDFRPVFCFVDFLAVETLSSISSSLDSCESESSLEDALSEKEVIYLSKKKTKKKTIKTAQGLCSKGNISQVCCFLPAIPTMTIILKILVT